MEVLLEELKKPSLKEDKLERGKKILFEAADDERDIGKITFILKMMPEFKKFIKFNNIGHEAIRKAANYLQYMRIPKGEIIFKQGQQANFFYGIINGKVSIKIEERV
jgi:hypothetical protein